MDKLLRRWAELEPETVQANESGVVIQSDTTLDFIYFDADQNYGAVQIAVQQAIARHGLHLNLNYCPVAKVWSAGLSRSNELKPSATGVPSGSRVIFYRPGEELDTAWCATGENGAIVLLIAYVEYLRGIRG